MARLCSTSSPAPYNIILQDTRLMFHSHFTWTWRLGTMHVIPKPTSSKLVKMNARVALLIFWICLSRFFGWVGSLMEKQSVHYCRCDGTLNLKLDNNYRLNWMAVGVGKKHYRLMVTLTLRFVSRFLPHILLASSPWCSQSLEPSGDTATAAPRRWMCMCLLGEIIEILHHYFCVHNIYMHKNDFKNAARANYEAGGIFISAKVWDS